MTVAISLWLNIAFLQIALSACPINFSMDYHERVKTVYREAAEKFADDLRPNQKMLSPHSP